LANNTIIEHFEPMTFTKDYFPGNNDSNGKELGSTETMNIKQHKGKLYAAMGNWMDYPIRTNSHGAQILRKDAFNKSWMVDTSFGVRYLRTEAIISTTFTKDFNNNVLTQPVNLLIAGANDISIDRLRRVSIFVRNDVSEKWLENIAYTVQSGGAGIRSFAKHTDKVTGKQWLFCGITEGSVIKAGYDPSSTGFLRIDPTKELENLGRVMAMTVCDGDLYAAAGVDLINNGADTVGGLYRRIDGTNPTWQLVYRWRYTPVQTGDEANIMRGITTVPATDGSGRQVIIGTRANPGVVERIEPYNNHQVVTELNIRSYFTKVFNLGSYNGPTLSAYNYFLPDTLNNTPIWWMSLWVNEPNTLNPTTNGAHFMVRYPNGSYKYQKIYDYNRPVASGSSLRANRTIGKSPFPEEKGVYYFGGYDCARDTSRNTSWIYKSKLDNYIPPANNTEFTLFQNYPNPFSQQTTIRYSLQESGLVSLLIYDMLGRLIANPLNTTQQSGIYTISLNAHTFSSGIYFCTLRQNGKNKSIRILVVK
jgi:hypothetical protein